MFNWYSCLVCFNFIIINSASLVSFTYLHNGAMYFFPLEFHVKFRAQKSKFPGFHLNPMMSLPLLRGPGCLHRGAPHYRGAPRHSRVWWGEGCFLPGSSLVPRVLSDWTSCWENIWYLLWERMQHEGVDPVLLDVARYLSYSQILSENVLICAARLFTELPYPW